MLYLGVLSFIIITGGIIFLLFKISSQTNSQLNAFAFQVNERLKEMAVSIQETHKGVGERLDNTANVIGCLQMSLGKIEESNRQIFEIGKNISELQHLLRAPKFRGEMGETMLGNLLAEVLPKERYKLQYQFKSGNSVDAVILMGKNIVPIDAKFPYENFKAGLEAVSDDQKNAYMKKFSSDVKNRINEVASKYILPDEGTFDFALMYIPAENIYYETTIKQELLSYALSKRIIPVSPNTFYAYLQVICLGLRGLEVEANSKEILANLGSLQQELGKFTEDFRLLGGHIKNAFQKYSDSERRLDKFQDKLVLTAGSKSLE